MKSRGQVLDKLPLPQEWQPSSGAETRRYTGLARRVRNAYMQGTRSLIERGALFACAAARAGERNKADRRSWLAWLAVEVQLDLIGMRPPHHLFDLDRILKIDPRLYQVFGEDPALKKELVIGPKRL